MKKFEIISKFYKEGVVAVIRGENADIALKTAEACIKGGVKIIEVAFTVPQAEKVIRSLNDCYTDVLTGAGTVLDSETARAAISAGAKFVVCPSFNADTVRFCNRYCVPVSTGVMTPTEMVTALEAGVDIIKLFPGDVIKPSGLKAFKSPFPYVNLMPTGGVSPENVGDWFKAGAFCVGAGGNMTAGAKRGDFKAVEKSAADYVKIVSEYVKERK